ncbi:hypothetical protein ACS77_05445 [Pseudomonas syringae]|uniref:Uncharacterized protein n=1 Tax=Pseudomonas syringae TaxID=317 RepID=A0A0L1MKQ3_PSESX|nr:hypothetical protein ACS77_05445 [Pseudomonas syringae]
MKPDPSTTKNEPTEDLSNPNDDGCVLGTAGRDEDPNTTTDWDKERNAEDHRQGPSDARGMPGYPREAPDVQAPSTTKTRPQTSEVEPGIETPEQDNDKVG